MSLREGNCPDCDPDLPNMLDHARIAPIIRQSGKLYLKAGNSMRDV